MDETLHLRTWGHGHEQSKVRPNRKKKKRGKNCPKPLICHGERQNESPLNFAHEQKSIHTQGVEKNWMFSLAI